MTLTDSFRPLDPKTQEISQHFEYTRLHNRRIQSAVAEELFCIDAVGKIASWVSQETSQEVAKDEVAILVTGSDGREEKGAASALECLVLLNNNFGVQGQGGRILDLIEILNGDFNDKIIDDKSEFKRLGGDSISCFRGESNNYFPSRIIDADYMVGNRTLLKCAKMETILDIRRNKAKMLERKGDRLTSHRKITRTGKSARGKETKTHFDLDNGIAFYNPEEYINSFKYGPLRLVQVWVIIHIIKALQRVGDDEKFISELPRNVKDKLQFLASNGYLKAHQAELNELIQLYEYFLWLYHQSEYDFVYKNSSTITFDPIEVKNALAMLLKLQESLTKANIEK